MELVRRPYGSEDDFWRIRNFLREVFLLNCRQELSWHVARLDYWRWHFIKSCEVCGPVEQVIRLWETAAGGEIAAVLHPFSQGQAWMHVHPNYRSAELEQEILILAEEQLSTRDPEGRRRLSIAVDEGDRARQELLIGRGYGRRGGLVRRWWRDLEAPLPETVAPAGYVIRSLGGPQELPARSWASWKAFHPDEPDEAYEGWDWYHNLQSAPLYRRDLDLVAAAPTGEVAAFCTIWYDDATRSAVCVLVGTAPTHQRRGLGKALILEGLRRLQRMGATRVFANAYDPPADGLYGSVLGSKALSQSWLKEY